MNGIERITARIEADAQADAERIEAEARAQCEAIVTEGEAKAQEAYWRRIQEGAKTAEERARRLGKAADMEAKKSILTTKQEIVGEAFQKAEERLRGMSGEPYIDLLASLAARAAGTGREELILSAEDRDAYGAKIAARANALVSARGLPGELRVSQTAGDFAGGVIVRDGDISVNCTIEALAAEARSKLAAYAASELFA